MPPALYEGLRHDIMTMTGMRGNRAGIIIIKRRNNTMKPIRIIQVGTGGWGLSWIGKLQASAYAEVAALVDTDGNSLNKAADEYSFDKKKCFSSLQDAVKNTEADAALVVVPPEAHRDAAVEALESGLHCLVEKPISDNIDDAKAIVAAGKKSGKKLMVSQNYRFKRAPRTARDVVRRGLAGDIGTVYINFMKSAFFTGFRAEMEEPLIKDMSIHHFDQIRSVLGLNPVSITATSWNTGWSWFKGNPCASVLFEMDNGSMVSYMGSWVSNGWETTWDGDWRIQGSAGEVHWGNNEVILKPTDLFASVFQDRAVEKGGKIVFDLIDMENEERMAVIEEFASAIAEDREPETSGEDNLYSIAMVLGAAKAAQTREKVMIKDLL